MKLRAMPGPAIECQKAIIVGHPQAADSHESIRYGFADPQSTQHFIRPPSRKDFIVLVFPGVCRPAGTQVSIKDGSLGKEAQAT